MTKPGRKTPATAACRWCGVQFVRARTGRPAIYCRSNCRAAHHNARRLGLDITLVDLYRAAGGRCGICLGMVDRALRGDAGPSVDHIVPVVSGGSLGPENLQLTHWRCNRLKGDREDFHIDAGIDAPSGRDVQLALFQSRVAS